MCDNKSNSTIKFRVNCTLKQDFKVLADSKGTTMSKLLCKYIELELIKDRERRNIKEVEQRVDRCDDLLREKQKRFKQPVKAKLEIFRYFKFWGKI